MKGLTVALLSFVLAVALATTSSAGSAFAPLNCSQIYTTVTLSPTAGADVDVALSGYLYPSCVFVPEASVDGVNWSVVGVKKVLANGHTSGGYVTALQYSNTYPSYTAWRFPNGAGYNAFRIRVGAIGNFADGRNVTLTTR